MLHIKLDQSWSTGLRHIHVHKDFLALKGTQLQSDLSDPARIRTCPKIHACPGYQKFDEDSIKMSELASRNHFSNYMSKGNFLDALGYLTP